MRLKHFLLQTVSAPILVIGLLSSLGFLLEGRVLFSLIFFLIAMGGAYLYYYPYKHMTNFVARPEAFKDVFYDENGLYYDIPNKPYIIRWNEIIEYRILDVVAIDKNRRLPLVIKVPLELARYIAWRKIDQEYASSGIMKIATIQFIKKDGSSIVLHNVLNPDRLIPIFDKYIMGNN